VRNGARAQIENRGGWRCWFYLAANLNAQQSLPTDPASLLRGNMQQRATWGTRVAASSDPQRVAWGAWLAKTDRQVSLIPQLVQKVSENQSLQEPGEDGAMLAILDALIELHARVPVAGAHRLYPRFAPQAIILLVGSGSSAQQPLLDIFDRTAVNAEWLAAGNVLFRYRTAGFVSRLMDKFTQHVTVFRGQVHVDLRTERAGRRIGSNQQQPTRGHDVITRPINWTAPE